MSSTTDINTTLDQLVTLTRQRELEAIRSVLESLPRLSKGQAFSRYMTLLYKGNGWLAKHVDRKDDKGADVLLANPKTPDSIFLIVQCKNQRRRLTEAETKIEITKFEEKARSEYGCHQFRVVAVNGFVDEATKLGEFNLLLDNWSHVAELIRRFDPDNSTEPEIELFAHNQRTFERIQTLWGESNRVAVVQPTGTGKTYLIAKAMSRFAGSRALVLAPSHPILEQLRRKLRWSDDDVDFMTYAKVMLLRPEEVERLAPQLIVLDELHRCGATEWGAGVHRILEAVPDAHVLGTTATPTRFLDGCRDMADELFDGRTAENLSLAQAIERRILPMPKYVCAVYTLKEEVESLVDKVERAHMSEGDKASIRQRIGAATVDWEKTSGIPIVLQKNLQGDLLKFIVFCKDKVHLDAMEEVVRGWFQKAIKKKRTSYRFVSEDPSSDENLTKFRAATDKSSVHLLFCIDMLNEGIHIDDVSGVVLLRPTESPIVFYQQIGRCIQVGPRNTPLIFDFVNNFRSIRATDFAGDLHVAREEERRRRAACGLDDNTPEINILDETREAIELFSEIEERLSPKEVAIRKTEQICRRYRTLDNLPKQNSPDARERNDANWLSQKKQAKKGRIGSGSFYAEMDAIPSKHNMAGMFDTTDPKERAIKRTHLLCKQWLAGRVSKKIDTWMKNVRQYKQQFARGQRNCGYWPEMDDVAKSYGLPEIFDVQDFKKVALDRLREVCARIAERQREPVTSSLEEQERRDAGVLSQLRSAKQGKGKHVFYPEMEDILKEFGLEGLLDSLEAKMLSQTREFCEKYKDGNLPTAQANDPNRKDGQWLAAKRRVKVRKATGKWYPRMDEIAAEFGLNGLFDYDVITEDRATGWLRRHYERKGEYPRTISGRVREAEEDGFGYRRISWAGIHRRFPLDQLVDLVRPSFSPKLVEKWNDQEINEGRTPIAKTGSAVVVAAQRDGHPITGSAMNSRLVNEFDTSLAELLRGKQQTPFSIELAAKWVRMEYKRTGTWPSVLADCIVAAAEDGYENLSGNALNKRLKALGTTISKLKKDIATDAI